VKVVLDTNVLLSAAFFAGICEGVLTRCLTSTQVDLILSDHIIDEFVKHGTGKLGGTAVDIERAVAELRLRASMVKPAVVRDVAIHDVDDLPVLGTAVASEADYLVTGDRELLGLGKIGATVIVSPRMFLERLRAR